MESASKLMDGLQTDTAETDLTMAPSDVSSLPPTPAATPSFNIVSITEKKLSPESVRDAPEREEEYPKYLPYDSETNPLCGGDFVFAVLRDESIQSATISFLFEHGGKRYGMTVGHLKSHFVLDAGVLFAYAANKATAVIIGHVVAFHVAADSLIFQLEDDIKADLYLVRLADDTKHVIDLSRAEVALNNLHAHEKEKCSEDYVLVGRGAQRRGTEGVFSTYSNAENDSRIIGASDVGMCWKGAADGDGSDHYASKYITVEVDCGMIIFDGNGDPLSMHHAGFETTGTEPIMYESYSVPLIHIIKAHQNFFPDVAVSETTTTAAFDRVRRRNKPHVCWFRRLTHHFLPSTNRNTRSDQVF